MIAALISSNEYSNFNYPLQLNNETTFPATINPVVPGL